MEYASSTMSPWQINPSDFPKNSSLHDKSEFMIRYALLASSFYNTQPWQFEINDQADEINIYADSSRWLKVADPDKRELYISLGCALENLLITIDYFGLGHRSVAYFPEGEEAQAVRIRLGVASESTVPRPKHLFSAINHRDTFINNGFKAKAISTVDLQHTLGFVDEHVYVDTDMGHYIKVETIEDREYKSDLVRLAHDSDVILFSNPEFRNELTDLQPESKNFNPWLSEELKSLNTDLETGKKVGKKESDIIANAPLFGVLTSTVDDPTSAVKVGQVFERLTLEASLHGIGIYPIFQLLEIPEMKMEMSLEKMLPDIKGIPQLVFAMGYVEQEPKMQMTPRLPLEKVMRHH